MSRSELFREILNERIVIFDGAMGTSIQKRDLTAQDFGGEEYEGCNEYLVLTRPDVILDIHRDYFAAGADVVETDTFGGTPLVLAEYNLQDQTYQINKTAVELARRVANEFSTPDKPRFVAGSIGPTTKSITVTGGVTFQQLIDNFTAQAKALIEGGADFLLVETCQDTRNVKAAIIGIEQAKKELGVEIPLMVSGTIEPMGTMLAGQGVEALYTSLEHADLLSIGLNCATGPRFMTDHIRSLSDIANCCVSCIPNAGLPDEEGRYNETPQMIASALEHFVDQGWVNILGGCCGTTAEYISAIAEMAQGKRPRQLTVKPRWHVSGIDYLEFTEDNRPIIVGERTNVIGSRKFKELINEGKFEESSEIGRKQVRNGAQVIDVCLADPDRNEMEDVEKFLGYVIQKVKAPIMIDSTDAKVIERALQYCQGKSIINSINLEDGEERFALVVPIARRYGAALIVGCIDDDPKQGMAVTVQRKVEVAQRSYDLLVNKYGVNPRDIIFDPLVFPCGTGDENYVGSAEQTIKGVQAIKEALPEARTVLGISNVSFGLPAAGREVLNSVFLYHCTKAGLDLAIVNSEKLERYSSISDAEKKLSEDLLYNRGEDPVAAFAAFYKDKKSKKVKTVKKDLPLEERLANYIVEATKEGLIEDLELARQKYTPLQIINGPLMAGMDEVGRQFGNNELIVAEVLQSAEVMKAAVAHLENFMEKSDAETKGSVILATVKGDVHDIGKNLVEIIFSNNGYRIINLGIKVPADDIIRAYQEHKPTMIGLSGLLVKSAQQMVITAQDLRRAGIACPILVGGAALSNRFTRLKIAPEYGNLVVYANDAMSGLDLANQIIDSDKRIGLEKRIQEETAKLQELAQPNAEDTSKTTSVRVIKRISHDNEIPTPPDYKHHVISNYSLEEILPYINPRMLYGRHLGLKGDLETLLEQKDEKAVSLHEAMQNLLDEVLPKQIIRPRAVYRFFPARSEGDDLVILDSTRATEIERFHFPRQNAADQLCISDFVDPAREDNVCLFLTSAGGIEVQEWTEHYKQSGEFLRSHMLQALAIETAEGFAEFLHEKIRNMWGFIDPPEMTMKEKFRAAYRGIRVSFGYPACPRLEDQEKLFALLDVEKSIHVQLTEGYMMEPEASVSALVFHHPEARYFNVSDDDIRRLETRIGAVETDTGIAPTGCSCGAH